MPPPYETETESVPINESNCYAYNKAIIDLLPGAFCILNLDKTIRFANHHTMEILGHDSPFECVGKNLLDYIAPGDRQAVADGLRRTLLKRVGSFSEYTIIRDDGVRIPILAASSLVVDKFGAPIGFVCVAHDPKHLDQAFTSKQLVSNRAFFYLDIMSHDISNQLQVVMTAAEILQSRLHNTEHEYLLFDILDAVNKCNRIIETSEIMEQIISSETKERSLREAVHLALMKIASLQDVDVQANLQIDDVPILADEFLEQLLFAILDNACIHNKRPHKMIWVQTKEGETGYSVIISDNGPGIPDKMKATLLDTEHRKGGLGLHLCRLISDKYGAKISICDRVENTPDLGTQVELWFPKIDFR